MNPKTNKIKIEFGDFQTPVVLANEVCRLLSSRRLRPASIIEPTCGTGNLLTAAFNHFPNAQQVLGFEINPSYVSVASKKISDEHGCSKGKVITADFFQIDWLKQLTELPQPILVIGNPPWVTNSTLGTLDSSNLPIKSNFQCHNGLDAMTGKSNFDISEWMLSHFTEWLDGKKATLAMLCKTVVARKVLVHMWKRALQINQAEIHRINAPKHFEAAVDACLLVCSFQPKQRSKDCLVFKQLGATPRCRTIGYHQNLLVSDTFGFARRKSLLGPCQYRWRSGIKHDCTRVMEFVDYEGKLRNGHGESILLEQDYLYPMLKGSQLASSRQRQSNRWMLVPQRSIGEDTSTIQLRAQKTWLYLNRHADLLDRRRSTVYKNCPRFSIFGVGKYSFARWKVAIAGFYKNLKFSQVGPYLGKPTVLDDTTYFLPCRTRKEMKFLLRLLMSVPCQELLSALVFWDSKRPVTKNLLENLNLQEAAKELGWLDEYSAHTAKNPWVDVRHSITTDEFT